MPSAHASLKHRAKTILIGLTMELPLLNLITMMRIRSGDLPTRASSETGCGKAFNSIDCVRFNTIRQRIQHAERLRQSQQRRRLPSAVHNNHELILSTHPRCAPYEQGFTQYEFRSNRKRRGKCTTPMKITFEYSVVR